MNGIQNFAFQDHLVRVVDRNNEPWFVGTDVCSALDIKHAPNALSRLDPDEKEADVAINDISGTKYATVISEAGVYRLVFTSRKEEAEKFKRWLAHEVLPQIRRTGQYAPEERQPGMGEALKIDITRDAPLAARVDAVRVARSLFGSARARELWTSLGLPAVPPASEFEGSGEAARVMGYVLNHRLDGREVKMLILDAIEGDEAARHTLVHFGVRPSEEPEGFFLSNTAPAIRKIFAGTPWADGEWRMVVRRLAGVRYGGQRQTFAGQQSRVTWFPLSVCDDYAGTTH